MRNHTGYYGFIVLEVTVGRLTSHLNGGSQGCIIMDELF
jgi:hypothetical protein